MSSTATTTELGPLEFYMNDIKLGYTIHLEATVKEDREDKEITLSSSSPRAFISEEKKDSYFTIYDLHRHFTIQYCKTKKPNIGTVVQIVQIKPIGDSINKDIYFKHQIRNVEIKVSAPLVNLFYDVENQEKQCLKPYGV